MKLSDLIASRNQLVRQATLANLAHAYQTLSTFAARIKRAGLRGPVQLVRSHVAPEHYWAALIPLAGHQSVIEEHFTDDDILELSEAIFFAADMEGPEISFSLEEVTETFLTPLRLQIEKAGITIDVEQSTPSAPL